VQAQPEEEEMRKLVISLVATTLLAGGAVAAQQAGAVASPALVSAAGSSGVSPASHHITGLFNFTTTMKAYTPIDVGPSGLSPGDGYVILGQPHRNGKPDGLATAQCVYTYVKKPVVVVCTVDYRLSNGLIATTGYSANGGNSVSLVVVGGTGAFANDRGYGLLKPTKTGTGVTLHLHG
jgi:hypothetical protein